MPCENFHSPLLKSHHPYNINKEGEIFTDIYKEKNHHIKLEYFCKDHNQLICVICIAKLKENGIGQHNDCEVCGLDKIKNEKKNKLQENIRCLEELENKLNEYIKSLKISFGDIEKDKDDLKLGIQNIFTKIRNILNEREDALMKETDKKFNDKYFSEDIIKKGEKLPKQIKTSLEKGKSKNKEWDNNNLNSYINDCINIENIIKDINIINESINKYNTNRRMKIQFIPKEEQLNIFLETIKLFGKIYYNDYSFRECPLNMNENRKYSVRGDNNNILTKTTGNRVQIGTICKNELDKSIEEHKWKIKILKTTQDKNIMIGVAPSDFNIYSSSYNTCGWYFFCNSSYLYSEPNFNFNCLNTNLSEVKDEVVVVMNMKKKH